MRTADRLARPIRTAESSNAGCGQYDPAPRRPTRRGLLAADGVTGRGRQRADTSPTYGPEMSFGGARVPDDCVVRTFHLKVMTTAAKQKRARARLVAGGDAWAWTIDRFGERRREGLPAANSNGDLWPDLRAHGSFGELAMHCAEHVAKCWSTNYFESRRRQKKGEAASLPLAKRYLVPVTWRKGEFSFTAELVHSDGDTRTHSLGSPDEGSRHGRRLDSSPTHRRALQRT